MPLSYEYSMGSVRAREKHLLSSSDLESMLACKTTDALAAFLRDRGFAEGKSIDEMLKNSEALTGQYLSSIVPEPGIFNAFLYPNDAHNIKSVIKGMLSGTDYKRLFMSPSVIDPQTVETAVKERKYSLLPEGFDEAAEKAYEVLSHTADARLADAYIDRQCMLCQLRAAKESGIPFLEEYINTDLFYKNIKIALRGALTQANRDYFLVALCEEIKDFNAKEVTDAALKGIDSLLEYLKKRGEYRCNEAAEKFAASPSEFEKFGENLLTSLAIERCKRAGGGAEAALGYYIACAAERKAVHIIAAGIETDADIILTRERLRDIYG